MELGIQLVIMVVFGAICAAIASGRGRSPVGWFLIGFIAPCLGLILVLVLPDMKIQQERERALATENRRLRERVKKDRMVSDARFEEAHRRLGAHDAALGLDTAGPAGALAGPEAAPPPLPPPPAAASPFAAALWHYAEDGTQKGPVDFATLRRLWRDRAIVEDTLVWTATMPEWRSVGSLDELKAALDA